VHISERRVYVGDYAFGSGFSGWAGRGVERRNRRFNLGEAGKPQAQNDRIHERKPYSERLCGARAD